MSFTDESKINVTKTATPASQLCQTVNYSSRPRPSSSVVQTHRRDFDKKASIPTMMITQGLANNLNYKRPISAIKVYNSTSSRTAMRAEIATEDSTNGVTMFSLAGTSRQTRTIDAPPQQSGSGRALQPSQNFYQSQIKKLAEMKKENHSPLNTRGAMPRMSIQ